MFNRVLVIIFILTLLISGISAAEDINLIRNPFNLQKTEESDEFIWSDMKSAINFVLTGIMEGNNKRIAVLNTPEGTELIKNTYSQDEVKIVQIDSDRIRIRYKGKLAYMLIGGELIEEN